jgi:hypothetical protein
MDELVVYFVSPTPKQPLLNVISMGLNNTKLQDLVWLFSFPPLPKSKGSDMPTLIHAYIELNGLPLSKSQVYNLIL